jgi:hypothetical protein
MSLIQKIYDDVHAALWAILVAFVLWFSVVVVPTLPQMHARAEMLRDHEIAAEQDAVCGKLGMGPQTAMYRNCISNLEEYRAAMQRRITDESGVLF